MHAQSQVLVMAPLLASTLVLVLEWSMPHVLISFLALVLV